MTRNALKVHDWFLIASALIALLMFFNRATERDLDPENFMVVNKIYIPDFYSWEDPVIVYDRTVVRDFVADWDVEVYQVGDKTHSCKGAGKAGEYKRGDDVSGNTLGWYVGKDCFYNPGDYLARTRWTLGNGVVIHNTSNVFIVSASGSPMSRHTDDNR